MADKLLLVTSREVLAGRMNEDDELRKLAVLGSKKIKKKSLWNFWRN